MTGRWSAARRRRGLRWRRVSRTGRAPARATATDARLPPPPAAWVLVDADTGAVLDGANEPAPHTAGVDGQAAHRLVAMQRLPADDGVPIALVAEGMPARKINVKAGQVWDLERPAVLDARWCRPTTPPSPWPSGSAAAALDGWTVAAGDRRPPRARRHTRPARPRRASTTSSPTAAGSASAPGTWRIVARAVLAEPAADGRSSAPHYEFDGGDGLHHRRTATTRSSSLYPGAIGMKTGADRPRRAHASSPPPPGAGARCSR